MRDVDAMRPGKIESARQHRARKNLCESMHRKKGFNYKTEMQCAGDSSSEKELPNEEIMGKF